MRSSPAFGVTPFPASDLTRADVLSSHESCALLGLHQLPSVAEPLMQCFRVITDMKEEEWAGLRVTGTRRLFHSEGFYWKNQMSTNL